MKLDFKNTFWLAIPVVAAMYAISWLFKAIGIGVTPLFSSVSVTSVITPTLGNKIFGFITGIVPLSFSLPTILMLFASAWATLLIGTFILGWNPKLSFLGKGETGKLASVIFLGGAIVYFILVGFTTNNLNLMTIIGSLIWIFAVSYVAGFVGGWIKKEL